jgi:hypothetical protein
MTKRSTKHDEARKYAAVQVASAGEMVRTFGHAVTRAIKATGFKLPSPRHPQATQATQAIDITLAECEGVLEGAVDQTGLDRAMFLSRVVRAMVVVERAKIHKDARGWVTRHFELEPRRRASQDEAAA